MGNTTQNNIFNKFLNQQSNNAICPADMYSQINKHKWCTFEVYDFGTNTVDLIYLSCLFILSIVIARFLGLLNGYLNNKRYKKYFGKMYKWAYMIVFAWLLLSIMKTCLSVVVFKIYMSKDFDNSEIENSQDPDIHSTIVILANVYNFLNTSTAFLINLVMILIPFQWLKIALQIISKSQIIVQQIEVTIQKWLILLKAIKIYTKYIRNIVPVLLFLQPFIFSVTSFARCRYHIINMYFIFCEASLILLFYLFTAYVACYLKRNSLIKLQENEAFQAKVQFFLLVIVLLVRMARNLLSVTEVLNKSYKPNGNCSNMNYMNNNFLITVLCFHNFFMHLLPVLIILYIYQPNLKKLKKYQELYDLQQDSCIEGSYNYKAIARGFYGASLTSQRESNNKEKVTVQYSK